MINRFLKIKTILPLLIGIAPLSAHQDSCRLALFEVKAGYFTFSDATMREIYDKDGWDIQCCISYPLIKLTSKWNLDAYAAVEYFYRSGNSLNGDEGTSISSIPLNIGLKAVYSIQNNTRYYLGIGPRYAHFNQHNDSIYVIQNDSGNAFGFFINTGFTHHLSKRVVLDIFGEYSYIKMHFHEGEPNIYTRATQLGGFTFGGGLGYEF